MWWLDRLVIELLAPLAVWVFANGLDEVFLDLQYFRLRLRAARRRRAAVEIETFREEPPREPRIALLVPCWREADVIARMIERNAADIAYENYEIWVGIYPNDPESLARVEECERRRTRVRHVIVPSDGPTTKADCLNHLLRGVFAYEDFSGARYEIFVQHDAEDVIDPLELEEAARLCRRWDMAQFPVFAEATPLGEFTHGIYCDEFAESHIRDLPVRAALGGFIPSAGVATALRREVVERLAEEYDDEVFDSASLTEDYVLGVRVKRLGFRQTFRDPLENEERLATREYFPRTFSRAVRQRRRWIIGNNFQAWERFGWNAGRGQSYWLWRDRKGLVNNPVGLAANLLFLYGALGWGEAAAFGGVWSLGASLAANEPLLALLYANLVLLLWRQGFRIWCVRQVYDWPRALTVPLRAPWSNLVNFTAAGTAVMTYSLARLSGRPLRWSKTRHDYRPELSAPLFIDPEAISMATLLALPPAETAAISAAPVEIEGEEIVLAGPVPPEADHLRLLSARFGRRLRFELVAPEVYARLRARLESDAPRARTVGAD